MSDISILILAGFIFLGLPLLVFLGAFIVSVIDRKRFDRLTD